jgi:hypothetical protein
MGFRTRTAVGLATALAGLTMIVAPAGVAAAYDFPSTNDANRTAGLPHVNEVSKGPGTVTLEFVNATNSLAFFEYRIDGATVGTTTHPVVDGDVIHPGVCVDGRNASICSAGPVEREFSATATVEVRLALGGERDWDFDWTTFTVGATAPDVPVTADDCRNGGWREFGFRNQGQCIRFVNTGKSPAAPLETERRSARSSETDIGSDQIDQEPRSSSTGVQNSDEPHRPDTVLPQNVPAPQADPAADSHPAADTSDAAKSNAAKPEAAKNDAAKPDAAKGSQGRKGSSD